MKTIRLDIDYPKRELLSKEGVETKPEQISLNVIALGMNLKYQETRMSLSQLKMWSKIQDKILDENGDAVKGDSELSDEQFDFLYETISTTNYPPSFANALVKFLEFLDGVKTVPNE